MLSLGHKQGEALARHLWVVTAAGYLARRYKRAARYGLRTTDWMTARRPEPLLRPA